MRLLQTTLAKAERERDEALDENALLHESNKEAAETIEILRLKLDEARRLLAQVHNCASSEKNSRTVTELALEVIAKQTQAYIGIDQ